MKENFNNERNHNINDESSTNNTMILNQKKKEIKKAKLKKALGNRQRTNTLSANTQNKILEYIPEKTFKISEG